MQVFNYNGHNITFDASNGAFINATEMAKPFNKFTKDWASLKSTQDFLKALESERGIPLSELILIRKGGESSSQGTWMHEDAAIEFARWLSPRFAIWCNDRIKELLAHGFTATAPTLEQMIANPDTIIQLATALKSERAEKERLSEQNRLQQDQLQKSAPKVEFFDNVLQSQSTYNTNQIAKELGMSAITLNKRLQNIGIQYKQAGQWLLYHKYQDKGYTKTRTSTYTDTSGVTQTTMQTVWTENGRLFIHQLMKQKKAE